MPSTVKTAAGLVGAFGSGDFYSFVLNTAQTVNLDLAAAFGSAQIALIDSTAASATLDTASASANGDGWIDAVLQPGTYFVDVSADGGSATDSAYTLTASLGKPAVGGAASNDGGTSLASAASLGTLGATAQTVLGYVGGAQQQDWYSFSLAGLAALDITLSGLTAPATIFLKNAAGTVLFTQYASGRSNGSLEQVLAPLASGNYNIEVLGSAQGNGFNLSVSAPPVANAGGASLATAQSIGALSTAGQTLAGYVGPANTIDYFAFTVGAASQASFTLSGIDDDAEEILYDAAGKQLATSLGFYNANASIVEALAALPSGSAYTIGVESTGSVGTNFTLTASASPLPISGGTGDATAVDVGPLSATPTTLTGYVGPADTLETYKIVLTSAATLNIAIDPAANLGQSGETIELKTAAGAVVGSPNVASSTAVQIPSYALQPGTYVAEITPGNALLDSIYQVSFNLGAPAVAGASADNSGTVLASAAPLGTLTAAPVSLPEWVGPGATIDLFSFQIAAASQVDLALTGVAAGAGASMQIEDQSGNIVPQAGQGAGLGAYGTALTPELAAGTYYVQVRNAGTATGYNLAASAVALPDIAGSTIATARNIGSLTAAGQTFAGFVGSVAPTQTNDFEFTLATAARVDLSLSGLSPGGSATLLLADTSNTTLDQASVQYISGNGSILDTLAAGTYVAEVEQGVPTAYTLAASATPLADSAGSSIASADSLGTLDSPVVLTGVLAANALSLSASAASLSVSDTAANVAANLDALESVAAAGKLTGIALTDGGTPILSITSTQLSTDRAALAEISGAFDEFVSIPAGLNTTIALSGAVTLIGSTGNDTIATAAAGSLLFLGAGATSLASAGADTIVGGAGASTVNASGNALYFGATGATVFDGGGGAATVVGGSGGNTVLGGVGSILYFGGNVGGTTYTAGGGVDTVVGFAGGVTATGGANGTLIFAGAGATNAVSTGSGSSTVVSFGANNSLSIAGAGNDIVEAAGNAATVNAAGASGSENVFFFGAGDLFNGGGSASYLIEATGGADTVNAAASGGAGNVFLFGANEVFVGGAGGANVDVESAAGDTTLTGGAGANAFYILADASNTARTVTLTNFNAGDDIGLQYYAPGAVAAALGGATTSGGAETLTLPDNTTVVFQNFSGLTSANIQQL